MTEMLQEFVDSRGVSMRVDRESGVIRGVKILGLRSRNGRIYPPATLTEAASLYEDAKVNVNHPKGDPSQPRDYQDRIGVIRNVAVREKQGLFADFHFNPKHALAEQLVWDAGHAPENVGFSHHVQARVARREDQVVVEAITKVHGVDLVADPATTRGLFEQQAAELERLQDEVGRLSALEATHQRRETIRRLLLENGLPDPDRNAPQDEFVVSRRFLEWLMAAEDEQAVRGMIEERAALVRGLGQLKARITGKPVSRSQHAADRLDGRTFAEAIT